MNRCMSPAQPNPEGPDRKREARLPLCAAGSAAEKAGFPRQHGPFGLRSRHAVRPGSLKPEDSVPNHPARTHGAGKAGEKRRASRR